jgi:N-acetylglucosamine-6-phosphate deacetylase
MSSPNTYFDLQVNGYGGVDFNDDDLTAEGLHQACELLARDGVGGILATIITDHVPVMQRRLENLSRFRGQDELAQRIITGFHIEGPFISPQPGYRGAHPAEPIVPANLDVLKRLLDAASGLTRLVTLAPECDSGLQATEYLAERGVVVAAGHTDASLEMLRDSTSAGVSMFTHLGNGCPMELHRHDNIIQRALSLADRLWLCFIGDGAHVPFVALGNYLRAAGYGRSIMVTDAIAPAGMGPGRYRFSRWELEIGADMVARAADAGHLVGSAITMRQTEANLLAHLRLPAEIAHRLTCLTPRKALGL